ncbi:MAG: SOUL family heme-binding protein, partial [Gammaproteobacteria bacterium]
MNTLPRLIAGLLLALWGSIAMAVDEPAFTVLRAEPPFELREYPGFIVAETWVEGDFDQAGRKGFRRIASFIFGDNRGADGAAGKIAMTAPVTMEPAGEKIAMTAPVTMETDGARWRIHFVMPAYYTMATLPKPTDPRIT